MQYTTQSLGKETAKRPEGHRGQLPPYQLEFLIKGGESSSQFQWLTIAKIELYFLIFLVPTLGLRLQRHPTNTKRRPPEKSPWKL